MAFAAQAAPPPKGPVTYGFIGFTDDETNALADTINGGQGMIAMHRLCQDDFGDLARLCTSKEFWLSPGAEAPSAVDAWIHNVISSDGPPFDFTGFGTETNCDGWTVTGGRGNLVTVAGFAVLLLNHGLGNMILVLQPRPRPPT